MEFTLQTFISATPQQIYNAWLNSDQHSKMTGAKAEISAEIGAKFNAWNSYISGKILELEPNKRILQSWRTSEFETKDEDSIVEITLHLVEGGTELKLYHKNLSEAGKQYIKGWENHYFSPMQAYFNSLKTH